MHLNQFSLMAVCPPFSVRRPTSTVLHPPSYIRRPTSTVLRPPSYVHRPTSAILCLHSSVCQIYFFGPKGPSVLAEEWNPGKSWQQASNCFSFFLLVYPNLLHSLWICATVSVNYNRQYIKNRVNTGSLYPPGIESLQGCKVKEPE